MFEPADRYPIRSGHRGDPASRRAAAQVDADPDRKSRTMIESLIHVLIGDEADTIPDDCATALNENPLYVRPLITAMVNMGILTKTGRPKEGSFCGKSGNIIIPSNDTLDFVQRWNPQTLEELRAILGVFIEGRIEVERKAQRIARHGAEPRRIEYNAVPFPQGSD